MRQKIHIYFTWKTWIIKLFAILFKYEKWERKVVKMNKKPYEELISEIKKLQQENKEKDIEIENLWLVISYCTHIISCTLECSVSIFIF